MHTSDQNRTILQIQVTLRNRSFNQAGLDNLSLQHITSSNQPS